MSDATPRPRSRSAGLIAAIPYALVALVLRLVIARVFFFSGQTMITGPSIPIHTSIGDFDVILPAQIKETTFQLFETQYAGLPLAPTTAAVLFTYAEFVLPICLVLGFATRLAALGLLVMTVLLQLYVMPTMWWPAHVYWIAILLVLMTVGPGALSIDALIRVLYRRDQA
jgi:putative oxidoreductase